MCANVQMYPLGRAEDLVPKWLTDTTEQWLKTYGKGQGKLRRNMAFFCAWVQKTDSQLVAEYKETANKEEWAKNMGNKVVEWFHWLRENKYEINSARAFIGNVRAFFSYHCRPVKIGRRKIPKQQVAKGEHEFNVLELRKMFHYADVRGKAILSTAVSLGWASDDFLSLKRKDIEVLVEKAIADKMDFIGFTQTRGKTGATVRSHLTPEAVESLRAYLDITPKDAEYLWCNGSATNSITNDTLNNIVKDMVEKAGIKTIGTVRFHLIRKFTMSALAGAGINEWHVKFMVGKEVPADIATYLINQSETLMEEFRNAYPRFSLTGYANRNHDRISELEESNKRLKEQYATLLQVTEMLVKKLEDLDPRHKGKMKEIRAIIERERKMQLPTTTA